MSAHTAPVLWTVSPWAPSLPNSDAWTLTSIVDDAGLKQVVAMLTSSFGYQTATSMAPAPDNATASSIGRGHPSTSKQSIPSVQPAAAAPTQTPQPRARIHSSTIKPRTERFPARSLYTIAEEPSVRFATTTTPASPRCAEELYSTPALAPRSTESNHDISTGGIIKFKTVDGVTQSLTSWADEVKAEIFEREADVEKLYCSWADEVDAEMTRDAVQTGENELVWKEGVAMKFTMRVGFGPACLF
ncbi:hypothetical protein DFH06DRAFT_1470914 [Mycena polygramma]|nr:hypothetical protein DFH06DRAFT_1470914 [Mycena polygramma]